jgi:hypothetical protein
MEYAVCPKCPRVSHEQPVHVFVQPSRSPFSTKQFIIMQDTTPHLYKKGVYRELRRRQLLLRHFVVPSRDIDRHSLRLLWALLDHDWDNTVAHLAGGLSRDRSRYSLWPVVLLLRLLIQCYASLPDLDRLVGNDTQCKYQRMHGIVRSMALYTFYDLESGVCIGMNRISGETTRVLLVSTRRGKFLVSTSTSRPSSRVLSPPS